MKRAEYIKGFKARQKKNRRLAVLAVHKNRKDNDGDALHGYFTKEGYKEAERLGWKKVSMVQPPVETKKAASKKTATKKDAPPIDKPDVETKKAASKEDE